MWGLKRFILKSHEGCIYGDINIFSRQVDVELSQQSFHLDISPWRSAVQFEIHPSSSCPGPMKRLDHNISNRVSKVAMFAKFICSCPTVTCDNRCMQHLHIFIYFGAKALSVVCCNSNEFAVIWLYMLVSTWVTSNAIDRFTWPVVMLFLQHGVSWFNSSLIWTLLITVKQLTSVF